MQKQEFDRYLDGVEVFARCAKASPYTVAKFSDDLHWTLGLTDSPDTGEYSHALRSYFEASKAMSSLRTGARYTVDFAHQSPVVVDDLPNGRHLLTSQADPAENGPWDRQQGGSPRRPDWWTVSLDTRGLAVRVGNEGAVWHLLPVARTVHNAQPLTPGTSYTDWHWPATTEGTTWRVGGDYLVRHDFEYRLLGSATSVNDARTQRDPTGTPLFSWVAGDFGLLYKLTGVSSDPNSTAPDEFTRVETGSREDFTRIHVHDHRTWVVGARGTVLKTWDTGDKWYPQQSGTDRRLLDVCFTDGEFGVAVGEHATLVTTVDGGETWKATYLHEARDLTLSRVSLFSYDDTKTGALIAGDSGFLIRLSWDKETESWVTDSPTRNPVIDISSAQSPAANLTGVARVSAAGSAPYGYGSQSEDLPLSWLVVGAESTALVYTLSMDQNFGLKDTVTPVTVSELSGNALVFDALDARPDAQGDVWVPCMATTDGASAYKIRISETHDSAVAIKYALDRRSRSDLRAAEPTGSGSVLCVGTSVYVGSFNENEAVDDPDLSETGDRINSFGMHADPNLAWACTNSGLYLYDPTANAVLQAWNTKNTDMPSDDVTCVAHAGGTSYIAGTAAHGVFSLDTDSGAVVRYGSYNSGLSQDRINCISHDGARWLVGTPTGLYVLEGTDWMLVNEFTPGESFSDPAGGHSGLYEVSGESTAYSGDLTASDADNGANRSYVTSLLPLSDGTTLVTTRWGAHVWDDGSVVPLKDATGADTTMPTNLPTDSPLKRGCMIMNCSATDGSSVYIGTTAGLLTITGSSVTCLSSANEPEMDRTPSNPYASQNILSLREESGTLWMVTDVSLRSLESGTWGTYLTTNTGASGLTNEFFTTVSSAGGYVLIGTESGLFSWNGGYGGQTTGWSSAYSLEPRLRTADTAGIRSDYEPKLLFTDYFLGRKIQTDQEAHALLAFSYLQEEDLSALDGCGLRLAYRDREWLLNHLSPWAKSFSPASGFNFSYVSRKTLGQTDIQASNLSSSSLSVSTRPFRTLSASQAAALGNLARGNHLLVRSDLFSAASDVLHLEIWRDNRYDTDIDSTPAGWERRVSSSGSILSLLDQVHEITSLPQGGEYAGYYLVRIRYGVPANLTDELAWDPSAPSTQRVKMRVTNLSRWTDPPVINNAQQPVDAYDRAWLTRYKSIDPVDAYGPVSGLAYWLGRHPLTAGSYVVDTLEGRPNVVAGKRYASLRRTATSLYRNAGIAIETLGNGGITVADTAATADLVDGGDTSASPGDLSYPVRSRYSQNYTLLSILSKVDPSAFTPSYRFRNPHVDNAPGYSSANILTDITDALYGSDFEYDPSAGTLSVSTALLTTPPITGSACIVYDRELGAEQDTLFLLSKRLEDSDGKTRWSVTRPATPWSRDPAFAAARNKTVTGSAFGFKRYDLVFDITLEELSDVLEHTDDVQPGTRKIVSDAYARVLCADHNVRRSCSCLIYTDQNNELALAAFENHALDPCMKFSPTEIQETESPFAHSLTRGGWSSTPLLSAHAPSTGPTPFMEIRDVGDGLLLCLTESGLLAYRPESEEFTEWRSWDYEYDESGERVPTPVFDPTTGTTVDTYLPSFQFPGGTRSFEFTQSDLHLGIAWLGTDSGLYAYRVLYEQDVVFCDSSGYSEYNNVQRSSATRAAAGSVASGAGLVACDAGLVRRSDSVVFGYESYGPVTDYNTALSVPGSNLPSSRVLCVTEDIDNPGHIWVGTDAGLGRVSPSGDYAWWNTSNSGLPSNSIRALLHVPGSLWVGTDAGAAHWTGDPSENWNWTAYKQEDSSPGGMPSSRVSSLAHTAEGVWIGTDAGLCLKRPSSSSPIAVNIPTSDARVHRLDVESFGLWVSTDAGAVLVDTTGLTYTQDRADASRVTLFSPEYTGLSSYTVTSVQSFDGLVWFSSGQAVQSWTPPPAWPPTSPIEWPFMPIDSGWQTATLPFESGGHRCTGTRSLGASLLAFSPGGWASLDSALGTWDAHSVQHPDLEPVTDALDALDTGSGQYWMPTSSGLLLWDGADSGILHSQKVRGENGGEAHEQVSCIAATERGTAIGSTYGLDIWDGASGWAHLTETTSGILSGGVRDVAVSGGDLYAVGPLGVSALSAAGEWRTAEVGNCHSACMVGTELWVSTDSGVLRWDSADALAPANFSAAPIAGGASARNMTLAASKLYAATQSGLVEHDLSAGTTRLLTKSNTQSSTSPASGDGLPDNDVLHVAVDAYGTVWTCGPSGVTRWDGYLATDTVAATVVSVSKAIQAVVTFSEPLHVATGGAPVAVLGEAAVGQFNGQYVLLAKVGPSSYTTNWNTSAFQDWAGTARAIVTHENKGVWKRHSTAPAEHISVEDTSRVAIEPYRATNGPKWFSRNDLVSWKRDTAGLWSVSFPTPARSPLMTGCSAAPFAAHTTRRYTGTASEEFSSSYAVTALCPTRASAPSNSLLWISAVRKDVSTSNGAESFEQELWCMPLPGPTEPASMNHYSFQDANGAPAPFESHGNLPAGTYTYREYNAGAATSNRISKISGYTSSPPAASASGARYFSDMTGGSGWHVTSMRAVEVPIGADTTVATPAGAPPPLANPVLLLLNVRNGAKNRQVILSWNGSAGGHTTPGSALGQYWFSSPAEAQQSVSLSAGNVTDVELIEVGGTRMTAWVASTGSSGGAYGIDFDASANILSRIAERSFSAESTSGDSQVCRLLPDVEPGTMQWAARTCVGRYDSESSVAVPLVKGLEGVMSFSGSRPAVIGTSTQLLTQESRKAMSVVESRMSVSFTLVNGMTLDRLIRDYAWVLTGELHGAAIGVEKHPETGADVLAWFDGTWSCGTWSGGLFMKGTWEDGTWLSGEWHPLEVLKISDTAYDFKWNTTAPKALDSQSTWLNGRWRSGDWRGGLWLNGCWESGTHRSGEFGGGTWATGEWTGGSFTGGDWCAGQWTAGTFNEDRKRSTWHSGVWLGGDFEQGVWISGTFDQAVGSTSRFGTRSTKGKPSSWRSGTWKSGQFWGGTKTVLTASGSAATKSVSNQWSVWNSGQWMSGDWYGGTWQLGTWHDGTWHGGLWIGNTTAKLVGGSPSVQSYMYPNPRFSTPDEFLGIDTKELVYLQPGSEVWITGKLRTAAPTGADARASGGANPWSPHVLSVARLGPSWSPNVSPQFSLSSLEPSGLEIWTTQEQDNSNYENSPGNYFNQCDPAQRARFGSDPSSWAVTHGPSAYLWRGPASWANTEASPTDALSVAPYETSPWSDIVNRLGHGSSPRKHALGTAINLVSPYSGESRVNLDVNTMERVATSFSHGEAESITESATPEIRMTGPYAWKDGDTAYVTGSTNAAYNVTGRIKNLRQEGGKTVFELQGASTFGAGAFTGPSTVSVPSYQDFPATWAIGALYSEIRVLSEWKGGVWKGGIWLDGVHTGGKWDGGLWRNGIWLGGERSDGSA